MKLDWKIESTICTVECIVERIGHDRRDESTYRRPMGGNAPWALQNQYRVVGSLRRDYYQIPIDPNPNSVGNSVYPSYGLHDSEREPDGYATFSWVHTFDPNTLLTLTPFYHYNGADYNGGPNDFPVISTVAQTAQYGGALAALNVNFRRNDLQAGVYGFAQHHTTTFSTNTPTEHRMCLRCPSA